ncbi:putative transcriptional regulator [Pseudescherichia vulneris NBRC 102420]|uniref:Putative transcriptional regulator n=1 Tax=Pseudescherichia vulneris NBRC 102420 TaxID=1115515 RepID=A0A090V7P2_PSEVU|nr:TetR/AcrR family transcriptional regulator [Pseudescherichia vulneris]GAL60153.1 putative transcriptional regulator [Pseudescherichia vulneris NBRC 102420]STQ59805.1 transcriptional regulator BetI [Pseudescherichia vulneris]
MARPKTIDRDSLLDAAENVLGREGAAALSFGAIATEAGISKASVQSVFGSREKVLDALLDRWLNKEQERYRTLLPENADAKARLLTHISATQQETSEAGIRTLTLLAAQAGTQSESMVNWYKERFGNLEATDEASRKRRILYLATEGAFMMRNMVGFESGSAFWDEVFNDLKEFAG